MGQDIDLVRTGLTIHHQAVTRCLGRQTDDVDHIGILTAENGRVCVETLQIDEEQVILTRAQVEGRGCRLDGGQRDAQVICPITCTDVEQLLGIDQPAFDPGPVLTGTGIKENIAVADQIGVDQVDLVGPGAKLDPHAFRPGAEETAIKDHARGRVAGIAHLQQACRNQRTRDQDGILRRIISAQINRDIVEAAFQATGLGDLHDIAATIGLNQHIAIERAHEGVELQLVRTGSAGDGDIACGLCQRIHRHQERTKPRVGDQDITARKEHIFQGQRGLTGCDRTQIKADIAGLGRGFLQQGNVILPCPGFHHDLRAGKHVIAQDDIVIARARANKHESACRDLARDIDQRVSKRGFQEADGGSGRNITKDPHGFELTGNSGAEIETDQPNGAGHIAIHTDAVCAGSHVDDD